MWKEGEVNIGDYLVVRGQVIQQVDEKPPEEMKK